jgi:hypothetical protein
MRKAEVSNVRCNVTMLGCAGRDWWMVAYRELAQENEIFRARK